jgi:hypothetical protein
MSDEQLEAILIEQLALQSAPPMTYPGQEAKGLMRFADGP